jgi:hypothetical protein
MGVKTLNPAGILQFGGLDNGDRSRDDAHDPEKVAVWSVGRPDRYKTVVTLLKKTAVSSY